MPNGGFTATTDDDTIIGPAAGVAGLTVVLDRLIFSATGAGVLTVSNGAGGTLFSVVVPANNTRDIRDLNIRATEGDYMAYTCNGANASGIAYYHLERQLRT